MTREYQVIYRHRQPAGFSAPQTMNFEFDGLLAAAETHIRACLTAPEFAVLSVTELRPVVDWQKPYFNLDEAAAVCGVRGGTFSKRKGDGLLPWFDFGNGCVKREVLFAHIDQTANEPARKLLKAA